MEKKEKKREKRKVQESKVIKEEQASEDQQSLRNESPQKKEPFLTNKSNDELFEVHDYPFKARREIEEPNNLSKEISPIKAENQDQNQ